MKNDYNEKKKKLLEIKQKIDNMIETDGVNSELIKLERKLDLAFNECIKSCNKEQDKNFIFSNYYSCKAMIILSKGGDYLALIECLKGFKRLITYVKKISTPQNWLKNFRYYKSRLKIITDKHLEIFGNAKSQQVNTILQHFKDIINLGVSLPEEIKKEIFEIILEVIENIVLDSGEIYTEEHLNRKERIIDLLNKISIEDFSIKGSIFQIEFILNKKHLFYYLRKIIPRQGRKETTLNEKVEKIKNLVNELKKLAGKEKNAFNKTDDEYKKFLAKVDTLTASYYENLWVNKKIIDAIKILEEIFKEIRKNIQLIHSPSFFLYFINEYSFVINFIKLLLVRKDYESFSTKAKMNWQKGLAQNVKRQLDMAIAFFKFPVDDIQSRELLIIEKSASGKFMEFIIFYLLKEIAFKILKDVNLKNKVLSQKEEINEILKLIKECTNPENDIQLNKYQNGTDIDILIKSKYAFFIKTGIISGSDKTKIKNEFKVAISAQYNPYFILDIGKNFSIVKSIQEEFRDSVKIIDVGEFFEEIYRISQDLGISIVLSRSVIKSFAGFTGG
ncbi:MAG: hypothetical protein NC926_09700 [Candidatus Omnitrophica bacterium]|nr:hypothetical protein [Candidatus Omnitrophota bacterium]